jgi:hypothetical protein
MTGRSPADLMQVYRVPGTGQVPVVVGVQRDGRVLLGEDTIEPGADYKWHHAIVDAAGIAALQSVLEAARVDQRGNQLDSAAEAYVTDEMAAAARVAYLNSEEDNDRGRIIDMLGATPLLGPFTAFDALEAFRRAGPGEGVRAALVAVARSRIADGSIKS